MNKFISLSLSILILNGCYEMSINNPPKPKKIPFKLEAHGDIRIDDYYWMRDDTRSDPELISYLESENDYFKNWRDSNVNYEFPLIGSETFAFCASKKAFFNVLLTISSILDIS